MVRMVRLYSIRGRQRDLTGLIKYHQGLHGTSCEEGNISLIQLLLYP